MPSRSSVANGNLNIDDDDDVDVDAAEFKMC